MFGTNITQKLTCALQQNNRKGEIPIDLNIYFTLVKGESKVVN